MLYTFTRVYTYTTYIRIYNIELLDEIKVQFCSCNKSQFSIRSIKVTK